MTTLEKAARALAVRQGEDPDMRTWDAINNVRGPDVWECLVPQVRAVLMAVREPGISVIDVGQKATIDESGNMRDFIGSPAWTVRASHTAMIDAILDGK